MELVKGVIQEAAETAVSYKLGQTLLRQADRALWVVEKSARWAVPPALEDNNAKEGSELIRPLPWVLFLSLLLVLRVLREGLSLANLVLGKPPIRAADIVVYIQSKRRYLRALKYQGNRLMRARASETSVAIQLLSNLQSLLGATLCFAGNVHRSNEEHLNDEEIVITKRKKKGLKERESGYASPVHDDNTMEKLIEKMVDMYGDSSDDSDYTLTNATSTKSDTTITSDEDPSRDTTIANPDTEPVSSTPKSRSPVPVESPKDCSDIQERGLLELSEEVFLSPSPAAQSTDLIESEKAAESNSSKIGNSNGQTSASTSASKKKEK